MWVWHHEMLTSPPEVLENGVPLMVQSPHLQQLLYRSKSVRGIFAIWIYSVEGSI